MWLQTSHFHSAAIGVAALRAQVFLFGIPFYPRLRRGARSALERRQPRQSAERRRDIAERVFGGVSVSAGGQGMEKAAVWNNAHMAAFNFLAAFRTWHNAAVVM